MVPYKINQKGQIFNAKISALYANLSAVNEKEYRKREIKLNFRAAINEDDEKAKE